MASPVASTPVSVGSTRIADLAPLILNWDNERYIWLSDDDREFARGSTTKIDQLQINWALPSRRSGIWRRHFPSRNICKFEAASGYPRDESSENEHPAT